MYSDKTKVDITEDQNLLDFLEDPTVNLSRKERERCECLAKFYFLKDNSLYIRMEDSVKRIPSVADRHLVAVQLH